MSARHIARTEAEVIALGIASCRLSVLASIEWMRRELLKTNDIGARCTADQLQDLAGRAASIIDEAEFDLTRGLS